MARIEMLECTVAGSLPKPVWLAETDKLWPEWRLTGETLDQARADAIVLAIKEQESAGIDIVSDGEQARRHFVHGFLEKVAGIDDEHKVAMGIRANRYTAMVPQVVDAIALTGRVHEQEAIVARKHRRGKLKFTLPGPMTIVDTVADCFYGDKVQLAMAFADLLNQEARALTVDGVDIIQFDEPTFQVYQDDAKNWGIDALHHAAAGLECTTVVHVCYGYGIAPNHDWKKVLGPEWRHYETIFPALAAGPIKQVSVECRNSKVPTDLLALLEGKDVLLGCIDVGSGAIETPEDVVTTIESALKFVPKQNIIPSTNCGMAPMGRYIARAKLEALGAGTRLARKKFA